MNICKCVVGLFAVLVLFACGDDSSGTKEPDSPRKEVISSITDPRDGRVYQTTQIGTQVWLGENLQYETDSSWCYNDDVSNCESLGRLYAGGTENLCPAGFHIPSQHEWEELIDYVAAVEPDIPPAKSLQGYGQTWYVSGNNEFSFGVPGAGYRSVDGSYRERMVNAYLATSRAGCYQGFISNYHLNFLCDDSIAGASVRCLKDSSNADDVLPLCDKLNLNETVYGGNGYYTCDKDGWRASNYAEYNAYGNECVENKIIKGNFTGFAYFIRFICDNGRWREATEIERNTIDKDCSKATNEIIQGPVEFYKYYICSDSGWRVTNMWDFQKDDYFNPAVEYGTLTDPRDQNTYRTVTIGAQLWMAENLNYADSVKTPNLKGNSWCYMDNPQNCEKAGRFYTFLAAMDQDTSFADNNIEMPLGSVTQGICPEGWHIPSELDWNALLSYVIERYAQESAVALYAGLVEGASVSEIFTYTYAFKSVVAWDFDYWRVASNASGFSTVPMGRRDPDGSFVNTQDNFNIWLASEKLVQMFIAGAPAGEDIASSDYYPVISAYNTSIPASLLQQPDARKYGYPVRCIKD